MRGRDEFSHGFATAKILSSCTGQKTPLVSAAVRGFRELSGRQPGASVGAKLLAVLQSEAQLRHFLPLTEKVIAQAQARIFEGQTRHPDKILSLFEEHTVVIRKGKAHKPNEFGRLVRIDEVENGIVSNYHIAPNNMADQQQWKPALEGHNQIFDRAPHLATADRGFWSAANEVLAQELGVQRTVLPGRGRLSKE